MCSGPQNAVQIVRGDSGEFGKGPVDHQIPGRGGRRACRSGRIARRRRRSWLCARDCPGLPNRRERRRSAPAGRTRCHDCGRPGARVPGITHDDPPPAPWSAPLAARRDPPAALDFAGVFFAVETLGATFFVGASTPVALPAGALVAAFVVAGLAASAVATGVVEATRFAAGLAAFALAADVVVAGVVVAACFAADLAAFALADDVVVADALVAADFPLTPRLPGVVVALSATRGVAAFLAAARLAGARRTDAERRDGVVGRLAGTSAAEVSAAGTGSLAARCRASEPSGAPTRTSPDVPRATSASRTA